MQWTSYAIQREEATRTISETTGTTARWTRSVLGLPDYDPLQSDTASAILSATGYITIRPLKKHVWSVELTESGTKSITGDKYAHEQRGDCDQWQVTVPLSKYDHLDVTGIVEDGVHAKADASLTFVITSVRIPVEVVH